MFELPMKFGVNVNKNHRASPPQPCSRGRQSAHFESNESQRRLTSAATIQGFNEGESFLFICVLTVFNQRQLNL